MRASVTIAAIATGASPGAIGIVRVSGPASRDIALKVAGKLPQPRHASLQTFRTADGTRVDHGLVLFFPSPASFTGEDMIEFHAHGGPIVLAGLLEAIYAAGAEPASPGEFSTRAFLNGKLDLLQAEAIADLISLSSERGLVAANAAMTGVFSARVRNLSDSIVSIRTHVEATIDFGEEAGNPTDALDLFAQVSAARDDVASLLRSGRQGAVLLRGVNVVIVGRPNTGKSTLLNRLAGEDRAIVSAHPGTTRDVVAVDINLNGILLTVHDTAGIRTTTDEIESAGIRRARDQLARADIVLYVYDDFVGNVDLFTMEPDAIPANAIIVRVKNKIDLTAEVPSVRRSAAGIEVAVSAHTGAGISMLRDAIQEAAGIDVDVTSPFLARERHLKALHTVLEVLDFGSVADFTAVLEVTAERLRQAQYALGELTGEFTNEDLLGSIFSRFCIGK